MLDARGVVEQERLDRAEEEPGGIVDARRLLSGLARCASDLLKNEIAAGNLIAAQQGAFELRDEQSARRRRKLPEKFA
jgi:hypothetical protein